MENISITKKEFLKSLQPGDECIIEGHNSYYKSQFTEGEYTYRVFINKQYGNEFILSDKFFSRAKKINLTHNIRTKALKKIKAWKQML